jgi:hypothetical protein
MIAAHNTYQCMYCYFSGVALLRAGAVGWAGVVWAGQRVARRNSLLSLFRSELFESNSK